MINHDFQISIERGLPLEQSKIGWIFKSKANLSYCLLNSGPMVRHYALLYGFHTLLNMLIKPPREARGFGPNTVYRQVMGHLEHYGRP